MKGEIPVCKRCCFCLPLRYGLIAWGYFKLIISGLFITALSYSLIHTLMMLKLHGHEWSGFTEEIITIVIALTLFVTDFLVTIVFIVGGHKKNVKLIRVFYIFGIVTCILMILLFAMMCVLSIETWLLRQISLRSWMLHLLDYSIFFFIIVLQTYFLVLVKSEIKKLSNSCEFRFVNNAAEAECTMKYEGAKDVAGEETETEEIQ